MSNKPDDLDLIRHDYAARTGTALADNGIAADESHLTSGGYHCGGLDLRRINAVGRDDYSIRQPRDRAYYNWEIAHGTNWASAMDMAPDWPNGGRAAWIRYNNNLRARLGARDPALVAMRGLNYTPDGTTKRRFDCLTGVESSTTDTVLWHTHEEFWRDTNGTAQRGWARARLDNIVEASIRNVSVDTVIAEKKALAAAAAITHMNGENDVIFTVTSVPAGATDTTGAIVPENGQCLATANGPFNLTGTEFFSLPADAQAVRIKMTWSRLLQLCASMKVSAQANLTTDQYSDFKAQAVPIVHDAAESGARAGASGPWLVTRDTPQ